MGWTGQNDWLKPSDVRRNIERTWKDSENWNLAKIASKAFGRRVWLLIENKQTLRKEVVLYLVDKMGDCYGYKDMHEDMGPFFWDCPVAFLTLASAPQTDTAAEWRAKVRTYHQKRTRSFQVGDSVVIYDRSYKVFEVRKRNIYGVKRERDGKYFRAQAKQMDFENGLDEARSMARAK
jgi:hypothetical protein